MIAYLTQFTISLLVFYMVYVVFLTNDTFFQFKRWYLLLSIILSLFVPLLVSYQWFYNETFVYAVNLPTIVISDNMGALDGGTESSILSFRNVLALIYLSGVLFTLFKFSNSLYELNHIITNYRNSKKGNYTYVQYTNCRTPFSFFNFIFMDTTLYSESENKSIQLHEEEHVDKKHSYDIVLIELLSVFLWFHPLVYLFKQQLKINHEYQADQRVVNEYSRKTYGYTLLKQSNSGKSIVFANYFFHSFIKKRIMMMYNKKSLAIYRVKYLVVLPLIVGLVFGLTNCTENKSIQDESTNVMTKDDQMDKQKVNPVLKKSENRITNTVVDANQKTMAVQKNTEVPPPPPPPPPPMKLDEEGNEVFKVVEQMPRFPGCEDQADQESRKKCAQKKMLQYVYNNLKYPESAKEKGVQGTAVVRFVVNKTGKIEKIELARDPGAGCGEASLAVIEKMSKETTWIPGKQRGKTVSVMYTLPLKFKLEG